MKLDLSLLEDINDDMEFCIELAKEESVIIVPGKNFSPPKGICHVYVYVDELFMCYICFYMHMICLC